jgi:hypothetical protein
MTSVPPTCPQCREPIAGADVNVGKGVAYCRRCHLLHDLSELLASAELDFAPELTAPPPGTWLREDGFRTLVGARHRSLGTVAGLLFITLFWNGIVSVFVMGAVAGTLHHYGVPPPAWLPNAKGFLHGSSPLFTWLFLIPFTLVGLWILICFLSALFGRTEVQLTGSDGCVYVGVGPLSFRRRFDPAMVQSVKIAPGSVTKNGQPQYVIRIESEGRKPIKFGVMLTEERKRYVAAQARRLIQPASGSMAAPSSTFAPRTL